MASSSSGFVLQGQQDEDTTGSEYEHIGSATKIAIECIDMMGDSLSDPGRMANRRILGVIPGDEVSGLKGRAPRGSFTNGYAWSDFVATYLANGRVLEHFREQHWDIDSQRNDDIADAFITRDPRYGIYQAIHQDFDLDDPGKTKVKTLVPHRHMDADDLADAILTGDPKKAHYLREEGLQPWEFGKPAPEGPRKHPEPRTIPEIVMRSWAEGGLTAANWRSQWRDAFSRFFFQRHILSNLDAMRKLAERADQRQHISRARKAQTLTVEWSGANDLMTVNERPSLYESYRAVDARINNVRQRMALGYRHFILFNLPDMSLTPRFHEKTLEERDNARVCCEAFNERLSQRCEEINAQYPYVHVEIFDVATLFKDVYEHPEKYGFDPEKLHQPYVGSAEFDDPSDGVSPATGFMFWDDVHPSSDVHALIALHFLRFVLTQFVFVDCKPLEGPDREVSEEELLDSFRIRYAEQLTRDQRELFYCTRESKIDYRHASIARILTHALEEGGTRTRGVIQALGWIDEDDQVLLNAPILEQTLSAMRTTSASSVVGM